MKKIIFVLILLCLSSCSSFKGKTPNRNLQEALVRVSADYLRHVVTGNAAAASAMIDWDKYRTKNGGAYSRTIYANEMQKLVNTYPTKEAKQHPLLLLDLKSVKTKKDLAQVILQKTDRSAKEVKIYFQWVGRGWVIIDDSIFGPGGTVRSS